MKEKQKRTEEQKTTGGGGSVFDAAPGLPPNQMVSVSSGPYAEDLPVAGTSVGEVRKKFADRMDIDPHATSILNGLPVDENHILKAGENLMFVKHAGEKGSVTLHNNRASIDNDGVSMAIEELVDRLGPAMSTGNVILPSGIKSVLSQGPITIWVYEKPPHIAQLSWVRADSPQPFGPGTTYRNVRIALPYLIILAVFQRDGHGLPKLILKDECFFRNQPLTSLRDELCFPALLNCSKFGDPPAKEAPLSWICTQYLKRNAKFNSPDPGDRFRAGFEAVRYCLLETSFNLSSEHHEGNSWYGATKGHIPQIATIEEWEQNTAMDPLFVLDLPWLKTKHTLGQVADRIFNLYGAAGGRVTTSQDVERIIANA